MDNYRPISILPVISKIAEKAVNVQLQQYLNQHGLLRWLDWIFLGGYLPSLSINYVTMSKHIGKGLPQLYYIRMKISYDLGFIAIGVTMAT